MRRSSTVAELALGALLAFAVALAFAVFTPIGVRAQTYTDSPTSQWFRSLSSPYTLNCCDQADCRQTESDYHDGAWWALSQRTRTWVQIRPDQITRTVSIFPNAVLCEGDPLFVDSMYQPRVYCFAPPPIGF